MKTIRVVVPRSIIKRHYLHQEAYGESIVELDNGMMSDVYTNELGELDTDTNDTKLIAYLSKIKTQDNLRAMQQDDISLISITKMDAETIKKWFEMSPWRQFSLIKHSEEIILRYISHARTMNSDVFLCKIKDQSVGLLGYDIIDNSAIMMCEMYKHHLLNDVYYDVIIKILRDYVISHYTLDKIIFTVFDFDYTFIESLSKNNFIKANRTKIRIPTLTGSLYQMEYEYKQK